MSDAVLDLTDVEATYGEGPVLRGLSLAVDRGETVSLVGRNGAGKTTTLKAISGVLQPTAGQVSHNGTDITDRSPAQTANRGVGYVPEDRQVFPDLTVQENLRMGGLRTEDGSFTESDIYELFPVLEERSNQLGSHLSGGEQQMLVIARALLGDPSLLLLDEPTEGLAPAIVDDVEQVIRDVNDRGVTILLVEQNIRTALHAASRHYVISKGEIVYEGTTADLESDDDVLQQHLGVNV